MMDKIKMEQMQFYGYHGVYPEERKLGQRYDVDLTLHLDLSLSGESDELADTVNYAEVYGTIRDVVKGRPFQLIEKLATVIVHQVFVGFPSVQEVTVRVIKPNPPFDIQFQGVVVELHRKRSADE